MTTQLDIQELACRLFEAEQNQSTISPLSESVDFPVEVAYQVQAAGLALKNEPFIGYKLGYTSQAMRQQMGVPHPNYGRLTESMSLPLPLVSMAELIHPRVEPEIALLLENDLSGPGLTLPQVQQAIALAYPALEVVDTRYHDYRFKLPDNIADNSSAARFILGQPVAAHQVDLRLVGVLLWRNGQLIERGVGADALGNPLVAIRWLGNQLGQRGESLPAGCIILTGGLTRASQAVTGDTFLAEFGGLGPVSLTFSD